MVLKQNVKPSFYEILNCKSFCHKSFIPRSLMAALFVLAALGCATGHCPREGDKVINPLDEVNRRVWVYKYDNSKQCEPDSGIKPEVMLKEFQGIKVWETKKENDGQPRVQFCGAYTGNAYLFLIEKKDLPVLKTKGYELWDF